MVAMGNQRDQVVRGLCCGATVAAGVVSGGQVFALLGVVPAARRLPLRDSARLHQLLLTRQVDRYLRPLSAAAAVLAAGAALLGRGQQRTLAALGVAGVAGVLAVSVRRQFPINAAIDRWDLSERVPTEYAGLRACWERGHALRTACGLAAFAALAAATGSRSPGARAAGEPTTRATQMLKEP